MAIPPSPRTAYRNALTAEIRILIRAAAGGTDQDISKLEVPWIDDHSAPVTLKYPQVVMALAMDDPPTENERLLQIGKLQAIRDALVRMNKPATGLSIAYTNLVSANQRSKRSDSTYELAQVAFAGLRWAAVTHRWSIYGFMALALFLTTFASWEATKASVGKSLLQVLEPLRIQQAAISTEKLRIEMRLDVPASSEPTGTHLPQVPVCDRYVLADPILSAATGTRPAPQPVRKYTSPEIRDVCGRDLILSKNFQLAHQALSEYREFWPGLVGGLFTGAAHVLAQLLHISETSSSYRIDNEIMGEDVEFWVAPIVQVITSFILPFVFGIVGSLLYVILQHYNAVRTNLLLPRDLVLAYLRVILGIVVAASVSLLITGSAGPAAPIQPSASGSTAPGSLVGSLTLSASLITFLAGFGAEAVFTLLEALVRRVFALPTDANGKPG